jgi:hypothetical protein
VLDALTRYLRPQGLCLNLDTILHEPIIVHDEQQEYLALKNKKTLIDGHVAILENIADEYTLAVFHALSRHLKDKGMRLTIDALPGGIPDPPHPSHEKEPSL